jgi:hypothetical protein
MIMSGLFHWGALVPCEVKETALSCDHGVDAKKTKSYSEGRPRLRNKNVPLRHGRKKEPRRFSRIIEY